MSYIRRVMKISQTKKKWKWPDTKDPYSKPAGKDYNSWTYIIRDDRLEKNKY